MTNKKIFVGFALFCLLVAALFFFVPWLPRAFDWNASVFAIYARNHLRYGFLYTKGINLHTFTSIPDPFASTYINHPQALSWFISLFWTVLGGEEATARLFPIICSLGTMLLIFYLAKRWFARNEVAFFSVVFLLTIPLFLSHADAIVHEPPTLFFSLLTIIFWERARAKQRGWDYFALFVAMWLGANTGWAFFLLVPFLCLYELWETKKWNKMVTFLAVFSLVFFGQVLAHIWLVDRSSLASLFRIFEKRSLSTVHDDGSSFTLFYWIYKQLGTLYLKMGPVAMALSLLYCLPVLFGLRRKRIEKSDLKMAVLLFWATTYIIVFFQGSFVHPYYKFYFIPFFSIASARSLYFLYETGRVHLPRYLFLALGTALALVLFFAGARAMQKAFSEREIYFQGQEVYRTMALAVKDTSAESEKVCLGFSPSFQLQYYMDRNYQIVSKDESLRADDLSDCGTVLVEQKDKDIVRKDGFTVLKDYGGLVLFGKTISNEGV